METQREVEVVEYGTGNENGLLLHVHHPRPKPRKLMVAHEVPPMMNLSLVRTIEAAQRAQQ
jgi:hypothetical protein